VERLRICLIAPAYPPAIGGAESFVEMVTIGLARAGVTVHVLTAAAPAERVADAVGQSGGGVHVVPSDPPPEAVRWEYEAFYRSEAIHSVVAGESIDIVHAFSHDAALAAAIAEPADRPMPLVVSFSEISTELSPFGQARSRFLYGLGSIDTFLAHSRYYAEIALRHGAPPERVRLLYAGVDVDVFGNGDRERGRQLLGLPDDVFLVTCPSRFTPRKGQLHLVEATQRLRSLPGLVVLLTGSANSGSAAYLDRVRASIAAADLDGTMVVRPELEREAMPDVLAASDLVVQPSELEGLGTAALEAMAAGTCTILTATRGFDEIARHGETAWVVPPREPAHLAAAVKSLYGDAAERRRIGHAAQRHVRSAFDSRALIDGLVRCYREAKAHCVERQG
jgi:glycosyltransferase involved in cell wall biosynthesis